MKKGLILLAAVALGVFPSCDDDNEPVPGYVSMETRTAFEQYFPSAKDVEWERKGDYMVVDFREGGMEKEAWFDNQGQWYLTETDIPYNQLPVAVQSAFESSDYRSWRVDDVDFIERRDLEELYVLDVESGHLDADLHYSNDGILVKVIGDSADGNEHIGGNTGEEGPGGLIPSQPTSSIESFITTNYPNARIIEIDREDRGYTEVEIIYENKLLELLFDSNSEWVYTKEDLHRNALPAVVANAVTNAINTSYPGYWIDDAEWVETPTGEWYQVELETSRGGDIYLEVTTDGIVSEVKYFKY